MVGSFAELAAAVADHTPRLVKIVGTIDGTGQTDMLRVGSNKSILGVGADARIVGFGLNISGFSPSELGLKEGTACDAPYKDMFTYSKNVIVRNITFNNAPDDGINVQCWSHHIWIDHNTFQNTADGALDIKRGSDWVTVSWNRFIQTDKTMLLGHDESNYEQDFGHLHVTYHHNWFDHTRQRHPRTRYCVAHLFNNWIDNPENSPSFNYMISAGVSSNVYADFNYVHVGAVEQVTQDANDPNPGGTPATRVTWMPNNVTVGEMKIGLNTGDAFLPTDFYAYAADVPADLPALLMAGAGAGHL